MKRRKSTQPCSRSRQRVGIAVDSVYRCAALEQFARMPAAAQRSVDKNLPFLRLERFQHLVQHYGNMMKFRHVPHSVFSSA